MIRTQSFSDVDSCIDAMLSAVGKHIVLGIPLGIGKPNGFVNALYRRACADPSLRLEIFTALTPSVPVGRSLLESRFLGPIVERLYRDFEPLDYATAVRAKTLPPNVSVAEFYFSPGSWLGSDYAQQNYTSENYSRVTRALIDRGVNAIAQAVARKTSDGETRFSLGSNPDLTLDLVSEWGSKKRPYLIGQVSAAMPFMPNDAETAPEFWDAIIDAPTERSALFAVPMRLAAASGMNAGQ